jgi:hypothetical protein
MTAFTVEHAVELPENTILRAVLNELEIREIPKRDGGTFNRLKWHFEITQTGEYLGKKVTAETSAVLNDLEGNVFREWAEALLGRPLDLGAQLFPSDLEGLPALITVGKEQDRKDPKKFWRRVETVMAVDGGGFRQDEEPPF